MNIFIEWHGEQFNVVLSNADLEKAFLSIKGCRIASGSRGDFVYWPATKNASTGKWWNHVWAGDKFAAIVLAKAQESRPQGGQARRTASDFDPDVPF